MEVSAAIKELRKKSLLSQNDFAQAIGVSFSTVNRWEKGKVLPNYKALKRIKGFCTENNIEFVIDTDQCIWSRLSKNANELGG
ncbi:MAG: helix-turn-helix transcriptional regulator [Bacillota bacterium]|nr:helix-turn-helix transcriptional regulator [Bacillota bacterium]